LVQFPLNRYHNYNYDPVLLLPRYRWSIKSLRMRILSHSIDTTGIIKLQIMLIGSGLQPILGYYESCAYDASFIFSFHRIDTNIMATRRTTQDPKELGGPEYRRKLPPYLNDA
jgi:hypothetical protein